MDYPFTLLFYIFLGVTFVNVAFYVFYSFFAFAKAKTNTSTFFPAVSVIICAKNEEDQLAQNIPKLLAQEYPEFEIILINNASFDDTEAVIEAFSLAHSNVQQVKVVANENFWNNKKYALSLGIKRAKYPTMLFTTADAVPASKQWLKEMGGAFKDKKALVLGYGAYQKVKGSWLNTLIRFENVLTTIQYVSFAKAYRPYMGVGSNLGYTAETFYDQKGFVAHIKLPAGDDRLFVNAAATRKNTGYRFTPESFTIAQGPKSFKKWLSKKQDHLVMMSYYKMPEKLFLGFFHSSQFLFFLLAVITLASSPIWHWVLAAIALRYLVAWVVIAFASARLKEKDLIYIYPLHEISLIIIQICIFISNLISKPARWK